MCLSKIRPVLLRGNTPSVRKMDENKRFVVFWMGAVCNGKLSVGQVIWMWKRRKKSGKTLGKTLLSSVQSGSTRLPSGLQQSRGAAAFPSAREGSAFPDAARVPPGAWHVPGWDWRGPSPSCAACWRNHYFTNIFSMGFVGWESRFGPCRPVPCGWSASSFPCSVSGSCS